MSPHLMTSKPPRYCPARLKKFRPPANLLIFPICPSPQRYFIINQSRSKRWMSKSSGLIRKNRWSQVHHIQSGTVLSLPESSWSNKNLPGAIASPPENPVRCFSSFWVMERWTLFSQRHRLSFMSGMRLVNNNPFLCILQGCPV